MVTSYFRPEVEIWLFRACTMKSKHYNSYLWTNRRIAEIIAFYKKLGSRKSMAASDVRPDAHGRSVVADLYHVPQNVFLPYPVSQKSFYL